MKNNNNNHFWERFAKFYGPFMSKNKDLYHELCVRIHKGLRKDMTVLELACGTGQLSFPLAKYVRFFRATDFSPAMIREAKKHPIPPQLHFSIANAVSLPFHDDSFDVVIIANALHVMPHPERALKEIHRVLKKDGILYAPTFLQGTTKLARLRIKFLNLLGFRTYHQWSEKQFSKFISEHGYTIKECSVIKSDLLPLCYLCAQKKDR